VAAVFLGEPVLITDRHSGAREARTRNLEIPGSMLAHRPGMTIQTIFAFCPEIAIFRGPEAP
jgi:hypothetical protein